MKRCITLFLFCFLLSAFWLPASGNASCFNPAGQSGDILYSGGMQSEIYCNGGAWIALGPVGNTTAGLVAWWKFDDGSGTSAIDSSGNGDTGTLSGSPTWTTGMNNGALNLLNANDYVNFPSTSNLQFSGAFSASVWIKTTALGSLANLFFDDESFPNTGWSLLDNGSNGAYILFRILPSGGSGANCSTGAACIARGLVNDGNWHLLTGTYDGTTVKIYLDGALTDTELGTGGFTNNTNPVRAKTLTGGSILLDDARIYNRALTAQDVKTLYTSTGPLSGDMQSNLVGWWKLDDGSSGTTPTTAVDSTGNGNTGTTVNSPTWGAGKINNAISLNGTSQYVDIANQTPFNFERTNSFSVSAWVYRNSNANEDEITAKQATTNSLGWTVLLYSGQNEVAAAMVGTSGSGNRIAVNTAAGTLGTGAWHHVVMTYSGNSDVTGFHIYIDGANMALTTIANSLSSSILNSASVKIGLDDTSDANYFNGKIDDVRIYSRALSASDVLTLYNSTATACASPVGYAGNLMYNGGTYHAMQFCNGSNWIPAGTVPGAGGGGCASPSRNEGDIIYSSANHVMQYCDGTNWQAMGGTVPVGNGLVGWWNFDEGSGTTAADSSGNANTGTTHNTPTWTTSGKDAGALTFNYAGSTSVTAPDVSSLQLGGSWTVSAWINPGAFPASGNYGVLAEKYAASFFPNYGIIIDNNSGTYTGGLGFAVEFDDTGGTNYHAKYVTSISTGTWYLVTGIWDSSTSNLYLYVNGALVATQNESGHSPDGNSGQALHIADLIGSLTVPNAQLNAGGTGAATCNTASYTYGNLFTGGQTGDLGDTICNAVNNTSYIPGILTGMAYLFGIVLIIWGVLKIKDNVLNPQQTSIWEGIARLVAGGAFFAVPYMLGVISTTLDWGITGFTNTQFAGQTTGNGLDAMMVNFTADMFGPMLFALNFFGYVAGAVLLMIGISRLLKSAQEGPRGPGGIGTIMTFLVAGAMISMSPMIGAVSTTFFTGGVGGATGAYSTQSAIAYTTGMNPTEVDHVRAVISAILQFMIVLGVVAFLRGIYIIREVAEGNSQVSLMAGITHIAGGALAVNLGPVMNAIQTTLGLTAYGINFS